MVYTGVIFKALSPYVKVFNEMLAKMEPNGLMEYWRQIHLYSITKIEEIGPQVLTIDHLKIGFLACCIPMVLAVIAFISEFAWSRLFIAYRKNLNISRKSDQNAKSAAKVCPSEFFQTQPQVGNVELEESIEMQGISVAEIHQETCIDLEDLIEKVSG